MTDHEVILAFRRKLRRKAIWIVVSAAHEDFPEVLEVYPPYGVPGRDTPSWTLWRSAVGVWLFDQQTGSLGEPTTVAEAFAIIEAILRSELRRAIRAIPVASRPKLPRRFQNAEYE